MRLAGILVVGSDANKELLDSLFDADFAPLVIEDMHNALKKLHRQRLAGVVLDRSHSPIDPLEFVLNVRDIDERVPIVILGGSAGLANVQMIAAQPRTFVVADGSSFADVVKNLQDMAGADLGT